LKFFFNLFKLLHDEWLEYLKRENKSNFEQVKNYYMPRKLKRFIKIDKKILDVKNEFILVYTEENFNETVRQNPEKKNIHYFLKENQNLLWQKSCGPISGLNSIF
jgi:hypothetical protein